MTTHVLIVNDQTFPLHLQYQFVGTGAGDEDVHMGLLADIKRLRPGDKTIFYVERVGFYGVFKVAETSPVVFTDPDYLNEELGKKLIYRSLIEPDKVYPKHVTEWQALEELPLYAQDVIWSLIYRKLKGFRGCTPITLEEADRLLSMIKSENNNQALRLSESAALTWNNSTEQIELLSGQRRRYQGERNTCGASPREMSRLFDARRAFEMHLQAYFTENIGIDPNLEPICGRDNEIIWIGNEVASGVGMQKIDIFTITEDKRRNREFRIVELKDEAVTPAIADQLLRYVNWTASYIKGAINSNIQPIVVAPKIDRKFKKSGDSTKRWQGIIDAFNVFNERNISKEIRYFEFCFQDNDISFEEVSLANP